MNSLPKGAKARKSGYYWIPPGRKSEIRLGGTKIEALQRYRRIRSGEEDLPAGARAEPTYAQNMNRAKRAIYHSMRKRCRESGVSPMTWEELDHIWSRAGDSCELAGIKFSMKRQESTAKRPWSPSLDRIDSRGGYSLDNCRLVCTAVNLALNEWGHDVLLRISDALARIHLGMVDGGGNQE